MFSIPDFLVYLDYVFWYVFGTIFCDFMKTKKMRDARTIILAAVSHRDLCYVSENEGFRFLCPGLFCVQDYFMSRTILGPGLFWVQDYFVSRGKNSVSRRRNPSLGHAPDPPDLPDPPDWCHQVPLRPSLPHAPGVRMTAVITNSLKQINSHGRYGAENLNPRWGVKF